MTHLKLKNRIRSWVCFNESLAPPCSVSKSVTKTRVEAENASCQSTLLSWGEPAHATSSQLVGPCSPVMVSAVKVGLHVSYLQKSVGEPAEPKPDQLGG